MIQYPIQLKKIVWTKNKNGVLFPKINNYSIFGFSNRTVYGCALYWKVKREILKEARKAFPGSKIWVSAEYPYYYESISEYVKDTKNPRAKLVGGFGDFFVYIDGFGYMIEIDETGPHSTTSAAYFKGNVKALIKKHEADLGKDRHLFNNGITSIHITEHQTLNDVINDLKSAANRNNKLWKKLNSPQS